MLTSLRLRTAETPAPILDEKVLKKPLKTLPSVEKQFLTAKTLGVDPLLKDGPPLWQKEWQASFRNNLSLLQFLGLDSHSAPQELGEYSAFPILVPLSFAQRMRSGDWNDPLLRQVLGLHIENQELPGFTSDAVGELPVHQVSGVLRKYQGRALLLLTGKCAVHCRYCFRREFPYEDLPLLDAQWEEVYRGLEQDTSLEEILFSGGDPLSLSDAKLRWHWERAAQIPHIRRIRIHTRLPVVLPSRVDAGLLSLISEQTQIKPTVLVLHINHPNELDAHLASRLELLRKTGALLLNQAVLLRGINDEKKTLIELSHKLLHAGVLPYYLHQLDRVKGSAHFEVSDARGLALMEELRASLPGYALPRFVREVSGATSKLEVSAIKSFV